MKLSLLLVLVTIVVTVPAFKPSIRKKLAIYRAQLSKRYHLDTIQSRKSNDYIKHPKKLFSDNKNNVIHPKTLFELNKKIGSELYQGDIALTEDQLDEILMNESNRKKRQAYVPKSHYPNNLWNRVISYRIDPSIDESTKVIIKKGIQFWENNTCLTFEENGPNEHYLNFIKGDGCWSYMGNISNSKNQDVSIGDGCENAGIVAHEVGHALGFYHTQARFDRDKYVKIDLSNINKTFIDNYNKETPATNDNFKIAYDYGSIMHYAENTFSLDNSKPVMISLSDKLYQHTMGNRNQPSFIDYKMMNKLYKCEDVCASSTHQCYNNGFKNPKNCNKCVCPGGFGGENCGYRKLASNGSESCGESFNANAEWQTLARLIGNDQQENLDDTLMCHWFLIAPKEKHVEIQMKYVGRICSEGCFYGGTEIKLGDFIKTGYRMCCGDHVKDLEPMKSQNHLAIVSLYTNYFNQEFQLQYRYVD